MLFFSIEKEYIKTFEDLPNEIIYEIFDFLDFHHAFQSFYDLNNRFQNIFVDSNLPIKINISSISKSSFHHYFSHIIKPHAYRIQTFKLSTPFAADMTLLILPIMANFIQLTTLTIDDIQSDYIGEVVNHLSCLPVLSSLVILSLDSRKNKINIYQKIFYLPVLKYCKLLYETNQYSNTINCNE